MNMNKVFEIGRLTRDPEVRYTQSGKAVCTFTIAVDDGYGEHKKAYFLPVVVWNKPAETCGNSLHKGSKVAITGKLTTRQYDNSEGKKVTITEIVADPYEGVEFLDRKQQGNANQSNADEDVAIPF
jgi:single-strand DNA-binding protein